MSINTDDQIPVTPSVITWARDRAGYSVDEAAKYFKGIAAWEKGESAPSYPQLELMADKFKCPVAVFFFPDPPDIETPKKSFRTLSEADYESLPRTIKGLLRKAQAMQVNLTELNDQKNPAQKVITKDLSFEVGTSLDEITSVVRNYLGISLQEQCSWPSAEEALERWRDVFAQVGVFVFKDAFRADGYFGFCLFDAEFPILYVNNSAAKTRQIFTLFHELAHLLFRTSGIDLRDDSYVEHLPAEGQAIEITCNRFAGRFLVPDTSFDTDLNTFTADREGATLLADKYNVSREVIYRKMLDRELVSQAEYLEAAKTWAAEKKPKTPGGHYYFTQFTYLGPRYIDLAFSRYYQRRFDEVRLAEYLNIKPKSLPAFEELYTRA